MNARSAGMLQYRRATPADVPQIIRCRVGDLRAGPADARMARYLQGEHHPQYALEPRVIFICLSGDSVVGYIGGHRTRRFDCDGELQYLYVVPGHRRTRVASELLTLLTEWFAEGGAKRICVDVVPENAAARAFYGRHGATELSEYWMVWADITARPGE